MGRKRDTDVFGPLSKEHPDDETFLGLLILRTEGHIYFENSRNIGDRIWSLIREDSPKVLLLDWAESQVSSSPRSRCLRSRGKAA